MKGSLQYTEQDQLMFAYDLRICSQPSVAWGSYNLEMKCVLFARLFADKDLDLIGLCVGFFVEAPAQSHLFDFAGDLSLLTRVFFNPCTSFTTRLWNEFARLVWHPANVVIAKLLHNAAVVHFDVTSFFAVGMLPFSSKLRRTLPDIWNCATRQVFEGANQKRSINRAR